MKRMRGGNGLQASLVITCCLVFLAAGVARAAGQPGPQSKPPAKAQAAKEMAKMSVVADSPEWQKLKTLVGMWEGTFENEGKVLKGTLEVRMTGDGSAVMHLMDKDTPHEMITMIHPDGKRILATHYCAAHNQPRMALVPSSAPNQVAFRFADGTNISPPGTAT